MKTSKHAFTTLLLILMVYQVEAQQVIASAGNFFENGSGSVSFTMGEPATNTFSGNGVIVTQGFQQPYNFYLTQLLNIPAGWSGISSFINPANPDIEIMLDSIMDELVIVTDLNGNQFWPEGGLNTIVNWDNQQGYWIKMNDAATLKLSGTRSLGNSLQLTEGWNLIPVWSLCEVPVTDIFNLPQTVVVKSAAGYQLYWPEKGINTLGNLMPGKAYLVKLSGDATIVFPECE